MFSGARCRRIWRTDMGVELNAALQIVDEAWQELRRNPYVQRNRKF